ncbi:hypothetical protein [Jiangella mangrovi]|uniref:Uncharacterized protein n=1 Tax=Jiangella mangrovi TaxID=1524084 RepID=A0A7W9GW57_9ACTN|nr:hypothetical protein [Jiangella mangrovi]MBB5790861.1 hypothetical protein [Jiangella mangrovi]
MLTADDHAWLKTANRRSYELHSDPSTTDPACYSPDVNPGARDWVLQPEAPESSSSMIIKDRWCPDAVDP